MKKILLLIVLLVSLNGFAQQYRYYKAQLHCHSTHSDGVMSPQTVAQEYINRGYEIVFLTDHNYMTESNEYAQPNFLAINAEEYTFDKHINGFFVNHTVDASGFDAQQSVDSIRAQGGLVQFNHPVVAATNDWSYTYPQFMELENGPDFIEIHNAGTDMIPLAQFNMNIWDSLLMQDRRIWGTSTDDMHKLSEGYIIPTIDIGWIMIRLNTLSEDSVRSALLRGDFYGSNGVEISNYSVEGNTINISTTNATSIKFVGDNGQVLSTVSASYGSFTRTTQKYVRIVLEKAGYLSGVDTKYAFTQPVFFENTNGLSNNNKIFASVFSYPNPCENNLNICFNSEKTGEVKIDIYDITGKNILSEINHDMQKGYNEIPINVSQLKQGLYIYTVDFNGYKTTQKFTKF